MSLNRTLKTIGFVFKVGYKLGAFPIEWNPMDQTVSRSKSLIGTRRWKLIMCYTILNTCFMGFRWIQAVHVMSLSYGRLFLNLFSIITYLTASGFHVTTAVHIDNFPLFFNRLLRTHKDFEAKVGQKDSSSGGSTAKIITYFIYSYSFFQFFVILRNPSNPKYFCSFLNLKGVPKLKLIPFAIFESVTSASAASMLLFYVLTYLYYTNSTRKQITLLSEIPKAEIPSYYRRIQLLNIHFNEIYKYLPLCCVTGTCMLVFIISSYASLRLYEEVKMPAILGFPMLIIATSMIILEAFPHSAWIVDASQDILTKVVRDHSLRKGHLHKWALACRPVEVQVANFYSLKQSTTLTYFETAISNTVTVLLTY